MYELKVMRSFRLAPETDALLRAMASKCGCTQTRMIERALAWYNITHVQAIVDEPGAEEDCIYDSDDAELMAAELLL